MAGDQRPIIVWFRRDLRLADNPALHTASESGRPVIPLYVFDTSGAVRTPGAASLWWLDKSLRALSADLSHRGSRLVLRNGDPQAILAELVRETGAGAVFWNRLYDGGAVRRDAALKAGFAAEKLEARSFNASLLKEPWEVETGAGEPYKVFTPFWKALRASMNSIDLDPAPSRLRAPTDWPKSDALNGWRLHPSQPDWSKGFTMWTPGEAGATERLEGFLERDMRQYPTLRDAPAEAACSGLSPHLHWGEIGPRQIWRAVEAAIHRAPALDAAADKFLSELAWRDFNHQILFQHPDLDSANYKPAFDDFPWTDHPDAVRAWKRGHTGYPLVDAGMRELWTTGFMHNRVRMICASFLIKHLMIDWRIGEGWFWDTLVDADEANNPANWQWVAGSGADAAPFFRIFSPMSQGERFDPDGAYVRRWVPELAKLDAKYIHAPWTAPQAALETSKISLGNTYPKPIVVHEAARRRALDAFAALRS